MRKSFTRLSSILVLLFLSVQMVFAQPMLDNANPADGATVAKGITQFTLTFKGDIVPGTGGAISLYKGSSAIKTFQVNGPNTVAANGKATFTNNAVTIEFPGVTYTENSTYWIDIEDKAIKDASLNQFNAVAAFADGSGNNVSNYWDFKISDTTAPTLAAADPLDPVDDAVNVNRNKVTRINFSEPVAFVADYTPHLGDFALYTSTDWAPGQNQEGGDLLSLNGPYDVFLDALGMFIDIEWFDYGSSQLLPAYTEMYIRIKPGILEDMSGNKFAGINNNTAWNFTTKDVTTFDPVITADHASGALWTNDNFYITFTEAIYLIDGTPITPTNVAAKLASEISLVDNEGNNVLVTLTLTGNVIKLDPTAAKLTSSKYTVNMNGAVVRYAAGTVNKAATKSFTSGDWAAPVIEQFITTNYRGTSFDIFAKANENCTIKYIVVKKGAGAAQVADIIGYTATGANVTGTTRVHRVAPLTSPEGNLNKGYTIGTGTTAVTYEIFAEGFITVTNPLEVQHRVDNLPATQGPANGEGEYMVYYVAYDASTTGVYDPDYSNSAPQPAILGNMTGVAQKEAHTVDILMPTVWFDGDSTTHGKLLNSDKKNPVALGANLATLHKKGAIYLNFNEGIRLVDGSPISNSSILDFITVTDGVMSVGFAASYSASTKQIVIVADSSFKSGSTVEVTIDEAKIEDLAGNEFQPADDDLRTQLYDVELYHPALTHYTPADAVEDFRDNCITVKFNDIIYVPASLESNSGELELLSEDPVSEIYVGKFFDITQGDESAAVRDDQTIKDDFDFTVSYDFDKKITTVEICRTSGEWLSENWYFVEVEKRLLDSNRSLLADGAGIDEFSTPERTDVEPFDEITTASNNDNLSMSFKYGDVRAPELIFFVPTESNLALGVLGLEPIDGKLDIAAGEQIGVYIDEYVMLGFADEIDFLSPGGQLVAPVVGNAFRRYFTLESGGSPISFDIVNVGVGAGDSLILYIDPYYPANGGYEEAENFKAGVEYTVTYISTQLEGDLGEAYQDQAKNKVIDEVVATFSGESTPEPETIAAVYTPAHGTIVASSTSEIVITFDQALDVATINAVPTIDITENGTFTTQTLNGVLSNGFKTVTYAITPNFGVEALNETEEYDVTVVADAFGFDAISLTWPSPVGADSTWTFNTIDETAPGIDWLFPADDAINVPLTTDLIIHFDEDVVPVTGKKLFLWDTGTSEKFSIDASNCEHIGGDSILVPNAKFAAFLKYNTAYHVTVQPGFVQDDNGNDFAGINPIDSWNFVTGDQPAVAFSAFSPKDATLNVQPLVISLNREAAPQAGAMYIVQDLTLASIATSGVVTNGLTSTNNKDWTISGFMPTYGHQYSVSISVNAFMDSDNNFTPVMNLGTIGTPTDVSTPVWVINFNDVAAPIAKFWPVDDEISIPYNAHLYIQFDEPVGLDNGTFVSVDPSLLATNIKSFITLEYGAGPTNVDFNVEFVDNDKRTLRITPLDPAGHNYGGGANNPTMQPETLYNLEIVGNNGTLSLADVAGNAFAGAEIDFTTEDITAPVITGLNANTPTANSAFVGFDIDEDGEAWVYVVKGTPSTMDVATIKANAQWNEEVVAGNISTGVIEVEETVGSNTFTVYVVAQDDETDPYANPDPSMWIFTDTGDNINSIRDVLPSPNVAAIQSTTFEVCDDDAPLFVTSDPVHGAIGVPTDQEIVLVFNENIQLGTSAPMSVTLRKSSNNAAVELSTPGSFVVVNGDSLVIYPAVDLEEETTYYVEIDRYAITDMDGCDGPNFFGEWVGKNNLEFQTVDMTAPVVNGYYPHDTATCISLDLPYARVYLTETNALKKFSATDETVRIYHNGVLANTIDFNSDLVTFGNDATKGKYLQIDLLDFIILSDVEVTISIPADVIGDEFGNKLTTPINWSFFTIDNVPPVVSWILYDWHTYFNNSASSEVGIAKFNAEFVDGNAGEIVANAPTHSILKIEFDEDIEMKAGTQWLPLSAFNAATASNVPSAGTDGILSRAEIFANIKVGNLVYSDATTSELMLYEVGDNYIVIGYKNTISELLVEAVEDGTSDLAIANYYFGSLLSETSYAVTIKEGSISDPLTCTGNRIVNVDDAVVTLNTRDDKAPALTFSTCEDACIAADGIITLSFDKPVVKSSFDISWGDITHESHTFDNLPLNVLDISATDAGKYIEFFLLDPADSSTTTRVEVKDVTFDGLEGISFAPKTKLVSEGLYMIKFNKWTVKEYIENDPTGTLFEGDSCIFQVFDYLAPEVAVSGFTPANGATAISSNASSITILFNEKIQKGSGTVKIRRENGQIYEEVDIANCTITPATGVGSKKLLTIPFGTHTGLEDFTLYYVEMPEGFVTDTAVCAHNPFKGLGVKLAAGNFLSADWSFRTSDATPPQLLANANGELIGLSPVPGDSTVAKYANLVMTFDENIRVTPNANAGVVIYFNNGDAKIPAPGQAGDFGNAVEFIPWGDARISISGSNIYNQLDSNVVTVNPNTVFDGLGTYYARVTGDNVKDIAGNMWSESTNVLLNEIKDYEWYFTITNDVAPVLVQTNPDYDGVAAPLVYVELTSEDVNKGTVIADLKMWFEDGAGNPVNVMAGAEDALLYIYEYVYNPVLQNYESREWTNYNMYDEDVVFSGNTITIKDVVLRSGINGDSVYYVTVDPGAVLNGFEGSQTWWPGISNGLRWRFQTAYDTEFIPGYEILSAHGEEAVDLEILGVADLLEVKFNEDIQAAVAPGAFLKVYEYNEDALVETVTIDETMIEGDMLTVSLALLEDETTYYVVIEEGAFTDASTSFNPSIEVGGKEEWFFHTGDNTAPVAVVTKGDEILTDGATCVGAALDFVLDYNESAGVFAQAGGMITLADAEGALVEEIAIDDTMISFDTLSFTLAAALEDFTDYVLTFSEGMVVDGDTHSPLASPEVVINFTTGDVTLPIATMISPVASELADTVLVIKFSEQVNAINAVATLRVQGEEGVTINLVEVDSVTYSAAVTELISEATYEVVIAAGAFEDMNDDCSVNTNDELVLTFAVGDLEAPVATFAPYVSDDYKNLKLWIIFDEEVSNTEIGNVVVYNAAADTVVLTIPVAEFLSEDNMSFSYTTSDLYYGEFYLLVDAGTFVDETAAPSGVDYAGATDKTDWPLAIKDEVFVECDNYTFSPLRAATKIALNTTISITFCEDAIFPPVREGRYVTIADHSELGVPNVNVFKYIVADSMITGKTLSIEVEGLQENTTYSVIIAQGAVTDEAGNECAGINDANAWFFTTGDFTAPTVFVDAVEVNNVTGSVDITSSEAGLVFLAPEMALSATALQAAVANGTAKVEPSIVGGEAVEVSTVDLPAGTYYAYAIDNAGLVAISENAVTVVVITPVPVYTIAQIQGTGDASPYVDQVVRTTGVVTGVSATGFFMQDANAKRSGIFVYSPDLAATVGIGTGIQLTGLVNEYYGLTQLKNVVDVEYVAPVVTPKLIIIEANQMNEDYESVLVQVLNVKTSALPDEFMEWVTTKEGVNVKIDNFMYEYTPDMGRYYSITGVVNYDHDEYKLAPRYIQDIIVGVGFKNVAYSIDVYPNPFDNELNLRVSSEVAITKAVFTNIAGQLIKEVINPNNTISTSELRSGVYFISLHTVDGIAKTERIIKR